MMDLTREMRSPLDLRPGERYGPLDLRASATPAAASIIGRAASNGTLSDVWSLGDFAGTKAALPNLGLTSATKRIVRVGALYYYPKVSSGTVRIFSNNAAGDDETEVYNTAEGMNAYSSMHIDAITTGSGSFLVTVSSTKWHRCTISGTGGTTIAANVPDVVCFGADENEIYGNSVISGYNTIGRYVFSGTWSRVDELAFGTADSAWNQPTQLCYAPTGNSGSPRVYAKHDMNNLRYYPADLATETKQAITGAFGDSGIVADEAGSRLLYGAPSAVRAIGYDGTGEAEVEAVDTNYIGLAFTL